MIEYHAILATFCVFFAFLGVSSTDYVPVFMWETTKFSEIVPVLDRINQDSFKTILRERVSKQGPILLFAEKNLSPEDFTLHDVNKTSPFVHLSSLKESAQVSYWPFVRTPITAISEALGRTIVEIPIKSVLSNPDLKIKDNEILLVDFNDAKDGEERFKMLQRHDGDIVKVYERIAQNHEDLITILTGRHSSWVTSEELRSPRRARETGNVPAPTEEPSNDTHILYHNPDIIIYVNSSPILSINGSKASLKDFHLSSDKNEENQLIVSLKSPVSEVDTSVTMVFNITKTHYWILIDIKAHNDTNDITLRPVNVYAPFGFSYHCIKQTFYNFNHSTIYLTFPGLQMQVFPNQTQNLTFGDAYDCVGFTSVPIWSGIFVTFILVLIMTFGLTMMMDIKTMDRFDDPKGKTITISATE